MGIPPTNPRMFVRSCANFTAPIHLYARWARATEESMKVSALRGPRTVFLYHPCQSLLDYVTFNDIRKNKASSFPQAATFDSLPARAAAERQSEHGVLEYPFEI